MSKVLGFAISILSGAGIISLWVVNFLADGISIEEVISAVLDNLPIILLNIWWLVQTSLTCLFAYYWLHNLPKSWKLFDKDVLEQDWAEGELEDLLMRIGREGFPRWLPWHIRRAG